MDSLYQRILGPKFGSLHPVLHRFHSSLTGGVGVGPFRIRHSSGRFGKLLAKLMRLPPAQEQVEARLEVTPEKDGERWVRSFGSSRLDSFHSAHGHLLVERVGPLRFRLSIEVKDGGMEFRTQSVYFWFVPLPRWLAPAVHAQVVPTAAGWTVAARLSLPVIGCLLEYTGKVVLQ